jgi:hypothetical protein
MLWLPVTVYRSCCGLGLVHGTHSANNRQAVDLARAGALISTKKKTVPELPVLRVKMGASFEEASR